MGVPGLFAWLRRKYPLIVQQIDRAEDGLRDDEQACDNLYIDANHIIHACTHPAWRDEAFTSEGEMFEEMHAYLERLFKVCRPQRLVMMAIDGVAPLAKMAQQRTRRFMAAHLEAQRKSLEATVRREMEGQAGGKLDIPALPDFDSNIITPGTEFMARLATEMRRFFAIKLVNDEGWRHLSIIVSDANEPGEGEHKIMRFIRQQRTRPEYDPNTRHIIYGQDADLILLGLLTREPHFRILREVTSLEAHITETGADVNSATWSAAAAQPLCFLNIGVLREYLKHEFRDVLEPSSPVFAGNFDQDWGVNTFGDECLPSATQPAGGRVGKKKNSLEFEAILQDFVLLTFLAGNDFLPNIPSLEIYDRPSGLDTLLKVYKDLLPGMGRTISSGSSIDPDRFKTILATLARDEEASFQRRATQKAWEARREYDQKQAEAAADEAGSFRGPDGFNQWVSVGELGAEALDDALMGLADLPTQEQQRQVDLRGAAPAELRKELAARVRARLAMQIAAGADADPVRLSLPGYRARWYEQRFGASAGEGVEKTARKVSQAYAQGLTWVLSYYCHGTAPVAVTSAHLEAVKALEKTCSGGNRKLRRHALDQGPGLGAVWDWFYPFYYAPLVSDLAKHATTVAKTKGITAKEAPDIGEEDDSVPGSWAPPHGPVRPLVQLMAVLPPASVKLALPPKLAGLILATQTTSGPLSQVGVSAALADMFPGDVGPLIDMSGKKWAHTAVVKLPFAEVKSLATAAQQPDPDGQEIGQRDHERNKFHGGMLLMHSDHPGAGLATAVGTGTLSREEVALQAQEVINKARNPQGIASAQALPGHGSDAEQEAEPTGEEKGWDHGESGSPTSQAAAEAAAPAAGRQERSGSQGGQAAEHVSLAEAGNVSPGAGEGLNEPGTAGTNHSRDARLLRIKTGAEAAAQEGGEFADAAASGNAAVDSGTAAAEGHDTAAKASGAAAAALGGTDSASGGGSEPATPRQDGPASRRSPSGSLVAVSVQSRSKAIVSEGSDAPGVAGFDSGMAVLGAGECTEPQQQPGWGAAGWSQLEEAGPEAAEGSTPEEEPQYCSRKSILARIAQSAIQHGIGRVRQHGPRADPNPEEPERETPPPEHLDLPPEVRFASVLSLLHAGSLSPPLPPDASDELNAAALMRSPAAAWHGQASGALVAVDFDLAGAPAPPFEACLLSGVDTSRVTVTEDMWQRQQRKSQGQRAAQLQARTGRGGGRVRGRDRGQGGRGAGGKSRGAAGAAVDVSPVSGFAGSTDGWGALVTPAASGGVQAARKATDFNVTETGALAAPERIRPPPKFNHKGPPQPTKFAGAAAAPQAVSCWDDQPAPAVAQPPIGGDGGGWSDDDISPAQTPGQEAWTILEPPAAAAAAGSGWDTGAPLGQAPAARAGWPPAAAAIDPYTGDLAGQAPAAPAQQRQQQTALPAPEPHAWGKQQRLAAGAVYEQDDAPAPRQPPRRGGWQTGVPAHTAQQDWGAVEPPAPAAARPATSEWLNGQPAYAAPQESTWDAEEFEGAPGAAQAAPHRPAVPAAAGADGSGWDSPKLAQPPHQSAVQRSWQDAQLPAAGGSGWDEPASPLAAAQPAQRQPQQTPAAGGGWGEPAAQHMAHTAAYDGWEADNAAQSAAGHWRQEELVGAPSSEASPGPQPPTAANLAKLEAASAAGSIEQQQQWLEQEVAIESIIHPQEAAQRRQGDFASAQDDLARQAAYQQAQSGFPGQHPPPAQPRRPTYQGHPGFATYRAADYARIQEWQQAGQDWSGYTASYQAQPLGQQPSQQGHTQQQPPPQQQQLPPYAQRQPPPQQLYAQQQLPQQHVPSQGHTQQQLTPPAAGPGLAPGSRQEQHAADLRAARARQEQALAAAQQSAVTNEQLHARYMARPDTSRDEAYAKALAEAYERGEDPLAAADAALANAFQLEEDQRRRQGRSADVERRARQAAEDERLARQLQEEELGLRQAQPTQRPALRERDARQHKKDAELAARLQESENLIFREEQRERQLQLEQRHDAFGGVARGGGATAERDTPAVKINLEDFPSIDAAAKDPQRQRSSHESTDGKRNLSDKRSLGNAGGRNNSIDHGGSDGSGSGQESHHDGARGGRGGGPRGRRRTKFRLMAHDAGFFVAPPAEGDHQEHY